MLSSTPPRLAMYSPSAEKAIDCTFFLWRGLSFLRIASLGSSELMAFSKSQRIISAFECDFLARRNDISAPRYGDSGHLLCVSPQKYLAGRAEILDNDVVSERVDDVVI